MKSSTVGARKVKSSTVGAITRGIKYSECENSEIKHGGCENMVNGNQIVVTTTEYESHEAQVMAIYDPIIHLDGDS